MRKFLIILVMIAILLIAGCTQTKGSSPTIATAKGTTNTGAQATPTCGNGVVDASETCSSCPADVNCSVNELCCSGTCTKPVCNASTDCNDNNKTTTDECLNGGTCTASCKNQKITTCTDSDSVCPIGCNAFNDNDCTALSPGTTAISGNLEITISNPSITICTTSYTTDKKTYLVMDVLVKNTGNKQESVSSMDFYAVDSGRNQFSGSILSYPFVLGGNCENADNGAFSSGNLLPNSKTQGKIWIELSKDGSYTAGKWYIVHKQTFSFNDIYSVYETQIN